VEHFPHFGFRVATPEERERTSPSGKPKPEESESANRWPLGLPIPDERGRFYFTGPLKRNSSQVVDLPRNVAGFV
jgi:hypothetical protein